MTVDVAQNSGSQALAPSQSVGSFHRGVSSVDLVDQLQETNTRFDVFFMSLLILT